MPLTLADMPLATRSDLQALVQRLTAPLLPHFSPGRARLRLGPVDSLHGRTAGELEGFARPLWGLVPLLLGGGRCEGWSNWLQGIAAGTDPASPEYWGRPGDYDQRSVEAAALGFALAVGPEPVWAALPEEARSRLAAWLARINDVRLVDSNWRHFRVLVNLGLARCGALHRADLATADLDRMEDFVLEHGWYRDGPEGAPFRDGRTGDYYNAMGFHFYNLLHVRLAGARAPDRAQRFSERARSFAPEFAQAFAADGSALPFGRSLTYRFAQAAFWGALAFADVEALPWPVIKGLYLRHLRWWLHQPILTETGLLTLGYGYENPGMAETYSSSGSPYWAFKVFLPLALPADHPFWAADEAPLPPRPTVSTLAGARLVLTAEPGSAAVTALAPGQPVARWPTHAAQKYSKFAYSTRFAFSVPVSPGTLGGGGFDSMLALSADGGEFRGREQVDDGQVREGVAEGTWFPWTDVSVRTWVIALEGDSHARIHRLTTPRPLLAIECGFAAPWSEPVERESATDSRRATVQSRAGVSSIYDLSGGRTPGTLDLDRHSHLLKPLASLPFLGAELSAGTHWLACLVRGGGFEHAGYADDFAFLPSTPARAATLLRAGKAIWSGA